MNILPDYTAIMQNTQYCRIVKAKDNQIYLFYYGQFLLLKRTWKNHFKKNAAKMKESQDLTGIFKNKVFDTSYKVFKNNQEFKDDYISKLIPIQRCKKISQIV